MPQSFARVRSTAQELRVSSRTPVQRGAPADLAQADALAAVDVAPQNLAGKAAGLPVHALLGGAFRDTVPTSVRPAGRHRRRTRRAGPRRRARRLEPR